MSDNTKQSTVIVTGAAAGIGLAIARAFALAGHRIGIVDLNEAAARAAASQITEETGAVVCAAAADVADPQACESAHRSIVSALGPAGILINNAGIMVRQKGWIEELPYEDFRQMVDIHLGGAINWCRLVMPDMRAARFGRIVNMSSVNAILPVPHRYTYVTVKKALRGLTEALALDCARAGITVNAIAPGYILTDTLAERAKRGILNQQAIAEHTPIGRWGQPEEIANAALFLASPASAYITGTTLCVDGGLSIRGDAGENLNESPFSTDV